MVEPYSVREERRSRRHVCLGSTPRRTASSTPSDARLGRLHSGASYKEIDSGHIALFEGADEFITLATEFLFQQHD